MGPGCGTETALLALKDDLRRDLDKGRESLLVFLDLSTAFDTTDHGVLLGCLSEVGGGGMDALLPLQQISGGGAGQGASAAQPHGLRNMECERDRHSPLHSSTPT